MSLRLPVYIASVNNLSDARYCAGMGVKWLGFSTNDLGSILSEHDLKAMLDWVEGIESVLEIRTHKVDIDLLKMDFDAYLSSNAELIPKDAQCGILEIDVSEIDRIDYIIKNRNSFDYLLITAKEASNEIEDGIKEALKIISGKTQLILGFGINENNLPWIEKELKPAAIMLKGGNEIKPGLKDFDGIAEILEYLEEDE